MSLDSMEGLLVKELKDLLSAEKQLLKALPKMAKAAASETLREAFEGHLEETRGQVERLEKAFKHLGKAPRAHHCKAMEGLIAEGAELIEEEGEPAVKDAALIAAAQRVEHYEIAGYGAAKAFADILGMFDVAALLAETLEEEKGADEKLNGIAFAEINVEATP